jgi:hypothetical protein
VKAIALLMTIYAAFVSTISGDGEDAVINMTDGTEIHWSDKRVKTFEETLETPSLKDHFNCAMTADAPLRAPAFNEDPGRARNETFLKSIYGHTPDKVKINLEKVPWPFSGPRTNILFNQNAGAAEALSRVIERLKQMPRGFSASLSTKPGTFNHRQIAGTNRLSAHSFGIAIDLISSKTDYWRWSRVKNPLVYRNRMPVEIVHAFEAEGFLWGGRWYHYDTMHFEYRPECFPKPLE